MGSSAACVYGSSETGPTTFCKFLGEKILKLLVPDPNLANLQGNYDTALEDAITNWESRNSHLDQVKKTMMRSFNFSPDQGNAHEFFIYMSIIIDGEHERDHEILSKYTLLSEKVYGIIGELFYDKLQSVGAQYVKKTFRTIHGIVRKMHAETTALAWRDEEEDVRRDGALMVLGGYPTSFKGRPS